MNVPKIVPQPVIDRNSLHKLPIVQGKYVVLIEGQTVTTYKPLGAVYPLTL